jgi:hypothetical protein
VRRPLQLPTPATVFVHASPPPTPSSITKSQSLSLPSQVSVIGAVAVHADQPLAASHVWVPKHVPIALLAWHVRLAPSMPAEHVQLPVTGWQNMPGCTPLASMAQV